MIELARVRYQPAFHAEVVVTVSFAGELAEVEALVRGMDPWRVILPAEQLAARFAALEVEALVDVPAVYARDGIMLEGEVQTTEGRAAFRAHGLLADEHPHHWRLITGLLEAALACFPGLTPLVKVKDYLS